METSDLKLFPINVSVWDGSNFLKFLLGLNMILNENKLSKLLFSTAKIPFYLLL